MKNGDSETEIPSNSVTVYDKRAGFNTIIKKCIEVDDSALNTLDDEHCEVLLKSQRDEIGSFSAGDAAVGIQRPKAAQVQLQ